MSIRVNIPAPIRGFLLIIVLSLLTGWVLNIIELAHATGLDGMTILRAIGVFVAPLGGVLGWL